MNGAFKILMNSQLLFRTSRVKYVFGLGDLLLSLCACQLEKELLWQSADWLHLSPGKGRCFLEELVTLVRTGGRVTAGCVLVWLMDERQVCCILLILSCSYGTLERWVWPQRLLEGVVRKPTET